MDGITFGSVSRIPLPDEVQHPTKYYPPWSIEFWKVRIDSKQSILILHGVSERGEAQLGYDSTCQLVVVRRGVPQFREPTSEEERKEAAEEFNQEYRHRI